MAPANADEITEYYARISGLDIGRKASSLNQAADMYRKFAAEYDLQSTGGSIFGVACISFVLSFVLMAILYHTCCIGE